jgi:uncharacterized membrane protein
VPNPEPAPTPAAVEGPPATDEPRALFPSAAPAVRKAPDFEGIVGVRLFAWLGGAVLFIAAALFLQYSIEHDLVPPAVRIAVGLLAGTAFLWGGDALRRRADWAGQALAGAGLGTLYASLYAARALYDLLPTAATFAGMALVTLVAGALALRRGAYVLAVLGLLGGFATPLLLSTGENRPVALFAYVAMLDAGVAVLAYRKGWYSLLALSSLGSLLLFAGWGAQFLSTTESAIPLVAAAVLGAIFAAPPALRAERPADRVPALLTRAAAGFGAAAPFIVAIAVATSLQVGVSLPVLILYLCILSIGAAAVSIRADLAWLPVASPLLSTLAMVARLDDDLVPPERTTVLAWFTVPALVAFALYVAATRVASRPMFRSASLRPLRISAGLALALSAAVVIRVVALEPSSEPVAPLALFIAIHVVGLIALAAIAVDATWLLVANGVSLVVLVAFWSRHEPARTAEFALVTALPMFALWAAPLLLARRNRAGRSAWLSSGVALAAHFPLFYEFTRATWPAIALAGSALGCAVLAVATLRQYFVARAIEPAPSRGTIAALGAIALAFVTASVPIALENQWITVAWAAEAAALAWLRRKVQHEGLVAGCALLAMATFIRLAANPWLWEYEPTGGVIFVNWLLYAFGIPIVSFLLAAHWLGPSPLAARVHLPAALATAAGILAFVLMNAEIADAFAGTVEGGLRFTGQSVLEDMMYSLGWGLFALATLVVGILRRSRGARAAALGVLVLTFGKVFLHDLWQLGSLYRVGSMIGLAVALLAVSFLLQRYVLRAGAQPEGHT